MGGAVRDLLLGGAPGDLDFTTDRLPVETEQLGREAGLLADGRLDRADNPLKHAPHTAMQAAAEAWTHAYSRELAVFPLATLKRQKYWPPVARVDNVYGDKNVFCSCIPLSEIAEEGEPEAFSEPMAV